MATYKSAKKQLDWAMQVLNEELQAANEDTDVYAQLLENAQAKNNEEDIDLWFKAFSTACDKLRTIESLHFMITHPDIHDENW